MKTRHGLIIILFFISNSVRAQGIIWANKILKSTERFEYQDNFASHGLGVPFVYQGIMNEKIDPFTEGYILNYEQSTKKNIVKFGFPRVVGAEQLVLGGIFNLGAIYSVKIIDLDNKEIEVYRMTKGSVSKFHNFNIFFEPIGVVAIKIEFDHNKINQWNLLKGVGLAESTEPISPHPNIYTEDEFYGKEKLEFPHENNKCMVFAPKLSHDGNTLFVVEECPGDNDQDIWFSRYDTINKKWLPSQKPGFPLNNKGHNYVASIGEKDKFLLLGNAYNADGSNAGDGVSVSHKKSDGSYEVPQNIRIPGLVNTNEHANFYLSGNEKVLLMSIQDGRSIGDLDLYVSLWDTASKAWNTPINLGSTVNTFLAEDSPCLMNDGRTLFFSSKGYVGFGGFDLYVTERLDDTWSNWSTPKNLGPLVNSKTDDYGFTTSSNGKYAYYNNMNFEIDSAQVTDIYRVNLPKSFYKEPKIEFGGSVVSEKGGKGIDAFVSIRNESGTMQSFYNSQGKSGKYALSVPVHDKYIVTIENDAYYKKTVELSYNTLTSTAGTAIDFSMRPLPDSGSTINLNNITFVKGTTTLSPTSGPVLDSLVADLFKNTKSLIEIGGHTDSKGDPRRNKAISLARAKTIGTYLIAKGIEVRRIKYKGYGAEKPLLSNDTERGRILNRRVTITYLGKLNDNTSQMISQ